MNYHVQDTWPQEILTNLPNVVEGKEIRHRQTDGEHKDLENYEKQGGKARAGHDDVVLKGDSLNVGKLLPALKAGNGCHQTKVDNKQGCCHEQLEPPEVLGDVKDDCKAGNGDDDDDGDDDNDRPAANPAQTTPVRNCGELGKLMVDTQQYFFSIQGASDPPKTFGLTMAMKPKGWDCSLTINQFVDFGTGAIC